MSNSVFALNEILIKPQNLLLDPSNPRLGDKAKLLLDGKKYSPKDKFVQDKLLEEISKGSHELETLKNSIRSSGYLNIDSIFVQEVDDGNYLVLEGNRRTAAIKSLLEEADSLSSSVLRSLSLVPVKLLQEKDPERARIAVSRILAIRHISGPKPWGAMLEAFHLYEEYLNETERFKKSEFKYDSKIARAVAINVNKRENYVRKALTIVRVYRRLQEAGVEVSTASYSLLKMSIDSAELQSQYFEIDSYTLLPSDLGIERFQNLMFSELAPITNPKRFRDFKELFDHRETVGADLLTEVEGRVKLPTEAISILERRLGARSFETQLRSAIKDLSAISIDSFRGVESELELIEKLVNICQKIGRVAGISHEVLDKLVTRESEVS